MIHLPERTGRILKIIVSEYIATGVAISSDAIHRGYVLRVSPATIRNEMAYLEEEGFIGRPHASSGGIPSDKGYRYYIEDLLDDNQITVEERAVIRRCFSKAGQEPDEWARLAVSILTQKLQNIALATPLRAPLCHFRHLDLVSLEGSIMLVVLILREGKTKQRFLTLSQMVSQDELTATANRMNEAYIGLTGSEIQSLPQQASPIEEAVTGVIVRMMQAEDVQQYEEFYLDGWRYLIAQSDLIKNNHIVSLVEALEKKSILGTLLADLWSKPGIRITIGNENEDEVLHGCSVIMTNYGTGERQGAIGVIGPTRMPYGRVISVVDYVSSLMSELVSKRYV